ncbi:MAG: hypothetical protein HYY30_07740 [Chloroflexi bacterium]|nr:hypothetical protein [Chloroflexota bacterium]
MDFLLWSLDDDYGRKKLLREAELERMIPKASRRTQPTLQQALALLTSLLRGKRGERDFHEAERSARKPSTSAPKPG